MQTQDYFLYIADEKELNEVLSGFRRGNPYPWKPGKSKRKIPNGQFGILVQELNHSDFLKPIAIVVDDDEQARLFARFSQTRPDLSPLSSWVHIMNPGQFERIDDTYVSPRFNGYEAAWAGMCIAEAAILSGRPYNRLKLSACMATQSFALARAYGLWGNTQGASLETAYLKTQIAFRSKSDSYSNVGAALEPLWAILLDASELRTSKTKSSSLVRAIRELDGIREGGEVEGVEFYEHLVELGAPSRLKDFDSFSAEDRLAIFDELLGLISDAGADHEYRVQLSFIAGYIATMAAGGSASLGIAEAVAPKFPEVVSFAYVLGGVGEKRSWAGGFDGLGRLVARELQRSWCLTDGPVCDASANEVKVLVDRQLNDPFVYLRLKQSRIATISLDCGVNIQVPFNELSESGIDQKGRQSVTRSEQGSDPLAALADALLPYFRERLSPEKETNRKRSASRRSKQSELKL